MFSFIIPVYNCENYLEQCIRSILRITFEKEVILVDDGSTDSSWVLCNKLMHTYKCIRCIRKDNGGAASARNVGLKYSKGDYIVFVDSDDFLDEKWEDAVRKVIGETADLFVYGMSFDYYNTSDQLEKSVLLSNGYSGIRKKEEFANNFIDYFQNNAVSSACNKVFKAGIIKENNILFNEAMTLYEDMDFVLRFLSHAESVMFIPNSLYHYRLISNDNHYAQRINNLNRVKGNLDNLALSAKVFADGKEVRSVISNLYMDILMSDIILNDVSIFKNKEVIGEYIEDNNVCAEDLSETNRRVYKMIEKEDYTKLQTMIKLKKVKGSLKRRIKKLICR